MYWYYCSIPGTVRCTRTRRVLYFENGVLNNANGSFSPDILNDDQILQYVVNIDWYSMCLQYLKPSHCRRRAVRDYWVLIRLWHPWTLTPSKKDWSKVPCFPSKSSLFSTFDGEATAAPPTFKSCRNQDPKLVWSWMINTVRLVSRLCVSVFIHRGLDNWTAPLQSHNNRDAKTFLQASDFTDFSYY